MIIHFNENYFVNKANKNKNNFLELFNKIKN